MATKRIVLIAGIVILGGFIFWNIHRNALVGEGKDDGGAFPLSGDATTTAPGIEYGYAGASTTPQKDSKQVASAPTLGRPIVIPKSFSSEDAALATESINKIIDAIKKNPENGALWADLGFKRKGIEDYVGAKEAYEFALAFMPNNSVIADNLGVIYADYLKDYLKAERNFRLALRIDPTTVYIYMRLFDLYRYGMKDAAKARAVLEEGLKIAPGDPNLSVLLETMM